MVEEFRMTLETMIDSLSRQDQLIAMELLWRRITSGPEASQPPAWHRDVVAERIDRLERGESQLMDWEVIKQRLQNPSK